MSDASNDTTSQQEPSYNYVQVISDEWCDRLGIPRGTAAQSFVNAVMDDQEPEA